MNLISNWQLYSIIIKYNIDLKDKDLKLNSELILSELKLSSQKYLKKFITNLDNTTTLKNQKIKVNFNNKELIIKGQGKIKFDSNFENIKGLTNFKSINHDIRHPIKILEAIDQIYHLACPASPKFYQSDPIYTTETCVLGSLNILNSESKNNLDISSLVDFIIDDVTEPEFEF